MHAPTTTSCRRILSALSHTPHRFLGSIPSCSQPLGVALPTDEHACSVSLPTWSSVVGYEEGNAQVTNALSTGYPRFVYHSYVVQLMAVVVERHGDPNQEDCLLLPTVGAAHRFQAFLQQCLRMNNDKTLTDNALIHQTVIDNTNEQIMVDGRIRYVQVTDNVHAVLFPALTAAGVAAKAYWQHTGEIVSSRRAEAALTKLDLGIQRYVTDCKSVHHPSQEEKQHHSKLQKISSTEQPDAETKLKQRIARDWVGSVTEDSVFLAPSGMAAIYGALQSARRYQMNRQEQQAPSFNDKKGGTSIVYGFPYLDTLKLCSRPEICLAGVEFFGRGDAKDLQQLEILLGKKIQGNFKSYSVLFTEVPSNPLLQCPDLYRLRELADTYNFCLVVDDTISNFLNVDVLSNGLADAVCSSLTKLVSGRGDAIAGSVVTNPQTAKGKWMQADLQKNHDAEGLWGPDAQAILKNSSDFVERNRIINATSEQLADWLLEQPDISTVYYPKHSAKHFPALMRPNAGYGGVMSILLHSHVCQRAFFDALDVAKGPSLGTNFTLVCPYTLLAHYHELDFAMSYNVPPDLLRIAVGLEPFDELRDKFAAALDSSRLYPKLCMPDNGEAKQ